MIPDKKATLLVYGYGNPGRRDDGLGIAFCDRIALELFSEVTIDRNYQLNVEDALVLAAHPAVLFVDASRREEADPFRLRTLGPSGEIAFTTHAMAPGSVLALCRELYGHLPRAYLLEIRGDDWEMGMGLSRAGALRLEAALHFMRPLLRNPTESAFQAAMGRSVSTTHEG